MTPRPDPSQRSGATSLTVDQARAKIVHDELVARPELAQTRDDIPALPRVAGWEPHIVGRAIDELVARGAITEAADGRLVVHPWTAGR